MPVPKESLKSAGRRLRRKKEDLDQGELSKDWVKTLVAREVKAVIDAHEKTMAEVTHKLEVTKQTLVVTVAALLTTRELIDQAAMAYETLGASEAFNILKTASELTDDERLALGSYIKRYNKLQKDTPVTPEVPVAEVRTRLTAEEIALEAANRRMQEAYNTASRTEENRIRLRDRVQRRVQERSGLVSETDLVLLKAVENQEKG